MQFGSRFETRQRVQNLLGSTPRCHFTSCHHPHSVSHFLPHYCSSSFFCSSDHLLFLPLPLLFPLSYDTARWLACCHPYYCFLYIIPLNIALLFAHFSPLLPLPSNGLSYFSSPFPSSVLPVQAAVLGITTLHLTSPNITPLSRTTPSFITPLSKDFHLWRPHPYCLSSYVSSN